MPRITISYRREDSGVITGRIFDRLTARYGREAVFRDIDNIPLGVDFREHVGSMLQSSNVILAIVGPHWGGPAGAPSRLANEADPVRVEIEAALRTRVPLIPVLVLGAEMPTVDDLPESLRDFAYRNAVKIDADQDFDVHIGRLTRAVDGILNPPSEAPLADPAAARTRRWPFVAAGAALAVAVAIVAVVSLRQPTPSSPSPQPPAQAIQAAPVKPSGPSQTQVDAERQTYQSARGNLAALKGYMASCQICESKLPAQGEIRQLEQAAQEDQTFQSARGNLAGLRSYVTSCQICDHKAAAQGEINQLDRAAQAAREDQTFQAARGSSGALRSYVASCEICDHKAAAQGEINQLDRAAQAAQEDQAFRAAHGNAAALRTYLNTCQLCESKTAAQAEIDRLQTAAITPPKPVEPPSPPPPPAFSGGTWQGQFFYSNGNAPVHFTWTVRINGTQLTGASVEPNTFGNNTSPVLRANLSGSIDANGHMILTKTYDGTAGVSHSVLYVGDFDAGHRNLMGLWHIGATQGRFAIQASP